MDLIFKVAHINFGDACSIQTNV